MTYGFGRVRACCCRRQKGEQREGTGERSVRIRAVEKEDNLAEALGAWSQIGDTRPGGGLLGCFLVL